MLKVKTLIALAVAVVVATSAVAPQALAILRHEKTIRIYRLKASEAFLRLLEVLLSDPELQKHPEVVAELRRLYDYLQRGDVLGANEVLSRIMSFVEDPEVFNALDPQARSLLPFISSWEFKGEGDDLEIRVNPERLGRTLGLIARERGSVEESVRAIEEVAKVVEEVDPALSIRLEEVAELLRSGSYEEAAKVYFEVLADLAEAMPRLLESETYDPSKLAALFSRLPISIGSMGVASSSVNFLVYLITFLEEEPEGGPEGEGGIDVERIALPIMDAQRVISKMIAGGGAVAWTIMGLLITPLLLLLLYRASGGRRGRLATVASRASESAGRSLLRARLALTRHTRDKIVAVYNATVNLMRSRGINKMEYETHREFAAKVRGRREEPHVVRVCDKYEKACFSGREPSEEDFKEALESFRRLISR